MPPADVALAYDALMHDDQNMLLDPRDPRDWLRPPVESEGAMRYLDTIRERWWIVVLITVLALAAAGAYVALSPKRYRAEADVLVTAFPNETAYAGLGLITESNEPTQTVSTAARLVSALPVAITANKELGLSTSPESLLSKISVEPVAESSLIAVQAEGGSGVEAQRLANGYAQAAVRYETTQLHDTIESLLPTLRSRRETEPAAERNGAGTLGQRIADWKDSCPVHTRRCESPRSPLPRPRRHRRARAWRSRPASSAACWSVLALHLHRRHWTRAFDARSSCGACSAFRSSRGSHAFQFPAEEAPGRCHRESWRRAR